MVLEFKMDLTQDKYVEFMEQFNGLIESYGVKINTKEMSLNFGEEEE